jgi:putative membrane protein
MATLAVVALTAAACSKKDNYATTDSTAASSTMTDTSAMAPASTSGTWSDANIVAILDEANAADSTAGSIAATKGTNSAVREFGRRMMRDHHQLRAQGQALATKLNITPEAPADDPLASDIQKYSATLTSTAKGKDFDKAYIDGEIDVHKAVLDAATKGAAQTQNTELKNLIQKAAPVVQAHLDLAESIQKKLQ